MNKKTIRQIQKGNQTAFRTLYDEFYEQGYRTAYSILRNESDARDAIQETFIRVFKNIQQFDIEKPFKPWFYRILVNESRRIISKRKNNQSIEEVVHENNQTKSKEAVLEKKETIRLALDTVSEEHKEVVVLKYIDGFSEKEIAEILEITLSAVKSRLFQARKKLQVLLREVSS